MVVLTGVVRTSAGLSAAKAWGAASQYWEMSFVPQRWGGVEQEDGLITVGSAQRLPSRGDDHLGFRQIALDEALSELLLVI